MNSLFHLAFPVKDLEETRRFYTEILGCEEGRSSDRWIDFNLFGHQIVAHLAPEIAGKKHYNKVDADDVPVPHFGVILTMDEWRRLAERLREKNVKFVIEPKIRFAGQSGQQATMFFFDPSGNALEFKAFEDFSKVFGK
jgi:uncharacterized protein